MDLLYISSQDSVIMNGYVIISSLVTKIIMLILNSNIVQAAAGWAIQPNIQPVRCN